MNKKLSNQQVETLKNCKLRVRMQLRTVYKHVEIKDGAVYRTKFVGFIVWPMGQPFNVSGYELCSVPTDVSRQLF